MLSNAKKGHANSSGEEIEIESLVLNHALFRYLVLTWWSAPFSFSLIYLFVDGIMEYELNISTEHVK